MFYKDKNQFYIIDCIPSHCTTPQFNVFLTTAEKFLFIPVKNEINQNFIPVSFILTLCFFFTKFWKNNISYFNKVLLFFYSFHIDFFSKRGLCLTTTGHIFSLFYVSEPNLAVQMIREGLLKKTDGYSCGGQFCFGVCKCAFNNTLTLHTFKTVL